MIEPDADAWVAEDPTLCPECHLEGCEDPAHLPSGAPRPNGRDRDAEAAEARVAHRIIKVAEELDRQRITREVRRQLEAEERPPVILPAFETLHQRLARPVVETAWRIQGWQPRQARVMLAAQYKAGKTTLVGNYIRSKVDGDPFLGRAKVTPITGTLVLLDLEMGASKLDAWYRDQGIRDADRVVLIPLRGQAASFNLLDEVLRARWVARLRDAHAEDLVLDCLRPVLDALGLDEQREAGKFLVAFDALLRDAEIPEALVVQHMGHLNERSRGDSRLRDWPDVEWRLVRRDDDPASTRFITAYGRDVDVPESQLVYDSGTRHLTITEGSRKDAKTRTALDAVLEVLTDVTALSGRALKQALRETEHARDTIDAALRLGVKLGSISTESGPRKSILYRASVRVSGSVRTVSQDTQAESVSECPAAFSKADTPDTPELPLDGCHPDAPPGHSAGHSTRQRRSPKGAKRNSARTRRRGAEGT